MRWWTSIRPHIRRQTAAVTQRIDRTPAAHRQRSPQRPTAGVQGRIQGALTEGFCVIGAVGAITQTVGKPVPKNPRRSTGAEGRQWCRADDVGLGQRRRRGRAVTLGLRPTERFYGQLITGDARKRGRTEDNAVNTAGWLNRLAEFIET